MKKKYLIPMLFLVILLSLQNSCLAVHLQLTVATDKPSYNLGYPTTVQGNLTLDGNPVTDGLVTVEIHDPTGQVIVVRTETTGTEPSKPAVEITDLFPSDGAGNPETNVNQGGLIGFKVTLKNNYMTTYSVVVILYIQYSNNIPFTTFLAYNGTIDGNSTQDIVHYPVEIEGTAPLGTTYVYANALTDLPSRNGFAYCAERKNTFTITSSSYGAVSVANGNNLVSTMSSQAYSLIFTVSSHGGVIGNYTIYASSRYTMYLSYASTKAEAVLITDVNGDGGKPDGAVDIMDLSFVSSCYGSYLGHGRWNPRADINKDNVIDITDLAMVSADYGKWGILP